MVQHLVETLAVAIAIQQAEETLEMTEAQAVLPSSPQPVHTIQTVILVPQQAETQEGAIAIRKPQVVTEVQQPEETLELPEVIKILPVTK